MEVGINVVIGFAVNFVANLAILPAFWFTSLTLENNFILGVLYTVISVARGYAVRRWANRYI